MQVILVAALTPSFQPSLPFTIVDGLAVVDFALDVRSGAPALVEWYFELTSGNPLDPETVWFREVGEQDLGGGIFEMAPVVRRFSALPVGDSDFDAQAARAHDFCRIQIRSAASVVVTVQTPFGLPTTVPAA